MSAIKNLAKRFGIKIEQRDGEKILLQKLNNILSRGALGEKIFETKKDFDIVWVVSNQLGIEYADYSLTNSRHRHLFGSVKDIKEYLFRLQVLIDMLWLNERKKEAKEVAELLNDELAVSPIDLGLRVTFYKNRSPQIYPTHFKLADNIVDDALGLLESYPQVAGHFEEGLKEFAHAKTNAELKDVVEDMYTVCDGVVSILLNNNKYGFRHLFLDGRANKYLNSWQAKIFDTLRDWMDKIKHGAEEKFARNDIEQIIISTALFARILLKK